MEGGAAAGEAVVEEVGFSTGLSHVSKKSSLPLLGVLEEDPLVEAVVRSRPSTCRPLGYLCKRARGEFFGSNIGWMLRLSWSARESQEERQLFSLRIAISTTCEITTTRPSKLQPRPSRGPIDEFVAPKPQSVQSHSPPHILLLPPLQFLLIPLCNPTRPFRSRIPTTGSTGSKGSTVTIEEIRGGRVSSYFHGTKLREGPGV